MRLGIIILVAIGTCAATAKCESMNQEKMVMGTSDDVSIAISFFLQTLPRPDFILYIDCLFLSDKSGKEVSDNDLVSLIGGRPSEAPKPTYVLFLAIANGSKMSMADLAAHVSAIRKAAKAAKRPVRIIIFLR